VTSPDEVDDEGNPRTDDPLRRQVDATLRFMALTTVIGLVIIVILAIAISNIRGVLLLIGFVYLLTSVAAYWYLRRTLNARLKSGVRPADVE
jgi:ABC-type bacteriocin/lantibiotic exporter with double-glycine peptidase domain